MIKKTLAFAVFIFCVSGATGSELDPEQARGCVPADEVNREITRLSEVIAQLTIENDLLRSERYNKWLSKKQIKAEVIRFLSEEEGDLNSLVFLKQHKAKKAKKYLK